MHRQVCVRCDDRETSARSGALRKRGRLERVRWRPRALLGLFVGISCRRCRVDEGFCTQAPRAAVRATSRLEREPGDFSRGQVLDSQRARSGGAALASAVRAGAGRAEAVQEGIGGRDGVPLGGAGRVHSVVPPCFKSIRPHERKSTLPKHDILVKSNATL